MHDEFFGHTLAALRFGASAEQLTEAVGMAFDCAGTARNKQVLSTFRFCCRHGHQKWWGGAVLVS